MNHTITVGDVLLATGAALGVIAFAGVAFMWISFYGKDVWR